MFSCSCEIGRHVYRLSTTRSSFNGASTACGNDGGRLAVFWKESIYEELKSCCSQKGEYWIGLVDRGDCPPKAPYRRDSTTSPCRNAAPLTVAAQPNNIGCQGVVIVTAGSQRSLPMAREVQCAQSLKFICQNPLPPLTTAPTTKKSITTRSTTITSTTTSTTRSTKTVSFSPTQPSIYSKPSLYNSSNSQVMEDDSSNISSNANSGIITGIVVCAILLLLLLVFLYFWNYKKTDGKNLKNFGYFRKSSRCSKPKTKQSNQMQDHIYSNVPAPDDAIIEAQYPDFSTNRPDYIAADDVVPTNDLQDINHFPSHYQEANNVSGNLTNHERDAGTYNQQVYSHIDKKNKKLPESSDEVYNRIDHHFHESLIRGPTNASATTHVPIEAGASANTLFDFQKVDYTSVRPLDQPTEVYAIVMKPKKTNQSA